jgi:hypothetical protein
MCRREKKGLKKGIANKALSQAGVEKRQQST